MKNLTNLKFVYLVPIIILLIASPTIYGQDKMVKKPKLDIENFFIASGYMGDGEYGTKYITLEGAYDTYPHSVPTCIKIKYTFGPQRWAGIYWQNRPDNWGDEPGNNYLKNGFTKVTFWAKGETGKEVIEFKSGGVSAPNKRYHDSFGETTGRVTLSKEWTKYEIDLTGFDLSNVIGGFCWVANRDYNNQLTIIFYIDDIYFE